MIEVNFTDLLQLGENWTLDFSPNLLDNYELGVKNWIV